MMQTHVGHPVGRDRRDLRDGTDGDLHRDRLGGPNRL
jgi:hypothetical protein